MRFLRAFGAGALAIVGVAWGIFGFVTLVNAFVSLTSHEVGITTWPLWLALLGLAPTVVLAVVMVAALGRKVLDE